MGERELSLPPRGAEMTRKRVARCVATVRCLVGLESWQRELKVMTAQGGWLFRLVGFECVVLEIRRR